jgi:hypothetical protein
MVNVAAGIDVRAVLRAQFKLNHEVLEGTIADCGQELVSRPLAGSKIHTISAIYAHALTSEDYMVNRVARDGRMLFETDGWDERLGITDAQNLMAAAPGSISFDMGVLREYAAAIRDASERFLTETSDQNLARLVDNFLGGQVPVAEYLALFAVTHLSEHTGEIAALKGVHGLKGLPF